MSTFDNLMQRLDGSKHPVVVVAMPTDPSTKSAVIRLIESGLAKVLLVGPKAEITCDEALGAYADQFAYLDARSPEEAAEIAVHLMWRGDGAVLMKGMLNTDVLLRAVLNKERGILRPGGVLTHVTVAQIPGYHKLLVFSDAAVIPYPTDEQRTEQLRYVLEVCRNFGVECPRVGLVHCSEKVDERHFPFTANYVALRDRAAAGDFGACIVDGPLDVKCCCSKGALDKKGIVSAVDGDADALIFPDIEAANAFYKTLTLFGGASVAGILCGCTAPVVLPSRGDSPESKFNSLLVALSMIR